MYETFHSVFLCVLFVFIWYVCVCVFFFYICFCTANEIEEARKKQHIEWHQIRNQPIPIAKTFFWTSFHNSFMNYDVFVTLLHIHLTIGLMICLVRVRRRSHVCTLFCSCSLFFFLLCQAWATGQISTI